MIIASCESESVNTCTYTWEGTHGQGSTCAHNERFYVYMNTHKLHEAKILIFYGRFVQCKWNIMWSICHWNIVMEVLMILLFILSLLFFLPGAKKIFIFYGGFVQCKWNIVDLSLNIVMEVLMVLLFILSFIVFLLALYSSRSFLFLF